MLLYLILSVTNATEPTKKDGLKPGCFCVLWITLFKVIFRPVILYFIYDSEYGERTLKCNLLSRTKTSQNLPSLSFKVSRPTLIMG